MVLNRNLFKNKCPFCGTKVKKIVHFDKIKKLAQETISKKNYQKYVDMVSVMNYNSSTPMNKYLLATNMVSFIKLMSSVPFMSGFEDGKKGSEELLKLFGAKLVIKGFDKIDFSTPRVYISNHTSYIDFIALFYLLKCGFLSSAYIKKVWAGKYIMNIVPLLIIDRGKSSNTVQKMKKYVKKFGSICLFPEAALTHPTTIIKFRTGAFNIGYPVYPIVIQYEPLIFHNDPNIFLKKILSYGPFTINITILPAQYPPFDSQKIENVRSEMAKAGNMALSRVSSRDISD
jgi:1-acyl-sn-glycerol-3-phosphate acyltransferase